MTTENCWSHHPETFQYFAHFRNVLKILQSTQHVWFSFNYNLIWILVSITLYYQKYTREFQRISSKSLLWYQKPKLEVLFHSFLPFLPKNLCQLTDLAIVRMDMNFFCVVYFPLKFPILHLFSLLSFNSLTPEVTGIIWGVDSCLCSTKKPVVLGQLLHLSMF